jgi:hypothetical protein
MFMTPAWISLTAAEDVFVMPTVSHTDRTKRRDEGYGIDAVDSYRAAKQRADLVDWKIIGNSLELQSQKLFGHYSGLRPQTASSKRKRSFEKLSVWFLLSFPYLKH